MSSRLTRRSVVAAGLWTAPAIVAVTAAPAYAASGTQPCADGQFVMRWADHYNATSREAAPLLTGLGAGRNGNEALSLSISSSFGGSMVAATSGSYANLKLSPQGVGGTGRRGLTLIQQSSTGRFDGAATDHYQRVTLTFGRPVSNLKLGIADIDSSLGQYQDRVVLSATAAGTRGALVTGSGTSAAPWKSSGTDNRLDPVTDARGSVGVDYTGKGASATYTLTFWNAEPNPAKRRDTLTANGLQGIFLTDLSFTASTCAP